MRDSQVLQYRTHPFNRAKRRKKRSTNPHLQLGRELLRDQVSQRLVMFANRRHASSKEQIECLIHTKLDAVPCQNIRKTTTA